uniref:ER lumen protein retaining receptor n=1 Tax=Lygus hesperus TaxID=30085 RepID=A0A0A9WJ69_LYGHE
MSYLRFTWIYAGDGIHISAALILVGWILQNETCKGISGRTQIVTTIVNCLRFAYVAGDGSYFEESSLQYELVINIMVTSVSLTLMYLMYVKYKKTVEKDYDTFWIEVLIILSVCLALAYNGNRDDPLNVLYCTSRYLESCAMLPQIYFVFRTGSKKLCVSLYVLLSFLYTLFYVYYLAGTDVQHWTAQGAVGPSHSLWPCYIQMIFYILYFILLVIVPKYKMEVQLTDIESCSESTNTYTIEDGDRISQPIPTIIVTRPQLDRQQSRLETPFLKKSLPSASSLVNFNPNGTARAKKTPSPFPKRKANKADNSKGLRQVLTLPNLSRTRSFGGIPKQDKFYPLETSSEENSPEDEGITFTARETACQSRQQRMAYVRQTSLPETGSKLPEASPERRRISKQEDTQGELENNNNLFLPGDEVIMFSMTKPCFDRVELKPPPKPGVPSQPQERTPDETANMENMSKTEGKNQGTQEIVGIIETKTYELKRFFKSRNGEVEDKPDSTKKVSYERARQKRVSVHHTALSNRNNWKTIACNFIGTSPTYVRRPSFPINVEVDSGDEFSSGESTLKNQKINRWRADVRGKPDDQNRGVSSEGTLKRRRATVHHTSPLQHNWKTMASAWLGTSHSEETRPSAGIGVERSLSETIQSSPHKFRRKTFWHI